MNYWTSYLTDIGIYRKINQDALLLKTAQTPMGTILLAAIADGLGGLKCGEVASNTMVHDLSEWFERELPVIVKTNYSLEKVKETLLCVIGNTHKKLNDYMKKNEIQLGTTVSLLFLFQNDYLIIHVGDTRVYLYDLQEMYQVTKDHTYVQREIDAGRMTAEEARALEQKNVLTQCIGASSQVIPEILSGNLDKTTVFLICSDGFRNEISKAELTDALKEAANCTKSEFAQVPQKVVDLIKQRGEKDNISSLFVKCF